MRPFFAFLKKELLDAARTGKLVIIVFVFVLFGIMNPLIAKLTPWMMEMFAADSGFFLPGVRVDAMTSWTQFFKNMPLALIVFVLLYNDIFTREYKSGTLLLILTKGLSRYKVVLAKAALLLLFWTIGYGICFGITFGYNAYYWDNSIAYNLFPAITVWWLFGVWVICHIVLFSVMLQNNAGVSLCAGGVFLVAYLFCIIPQSKPYSPAMLMDSGSLLSVSSGLEAYIKAIIIAAAFSIVCVAVSTPVMNRKQL